MPFISTRHITRCSFRRKMRPSHFHRLSRARIMKSRVGLWASLATVRSLILDSIFDVVRFSLCWACSPSKYFTETRIFFLSLILRMQQGATQTFPCRPTSLLPAASLRRGILVSNVNSGATWGSFRTRSVCYSLFTGTWSPLLRHLPRLQTIDRTNISDSKLFLSIYLFSAGSMKNNLFC